MEKWYFWRIAKYGKTALQNFEVCENRGFMGGTDNRIWGRDELEAIKNFDENHEKSKDFYEYHAEKIGYTDGAYCYYMDGTPVNE